MGKKFYSAHHKKFLFFSSQMWTSPQTCGPTCEARWAKKVNLIWPGPHFVDPLCHP